MKRLFIILSLFSVTACKEQKRDRVSFETVATNEDTSFIKFSTYYGSWVGSFVAEEYNYEAGEGSHLNKINFIVRQIEGDSVFGETIVAGNKRDFKGVVLLTDSIHKFNVEEPGDAKHDGKFTFTIVSDTLKGTWVSFRKDLPIVKRKFSLIRAAFVYDPSLALPDDMDYIDYIAGKSTQIVEEDQDGVMDTFMIDVFRAASEKIFELNGSSQELTEEGLKNLKKIDLEIIRNTIYARHGYTFKKRTYRQFFDYVDWYIPISTDVTAVLTELEKRNIALLNRFEKYAEDHYDNFGR